MLIIKIDQRVLNENPDDIRRSKSTPHADALLLATVKAVGIIQPPVVSAQVDGGNGNVIQAGSRRVRTEIAAELEEIEVLVEEAANDNGAMRSMVEGSAFWTDLSLYLISRAEKARQGGSPSCFCLATAVRDSSHLPPWFGRNSTKTLRLATAKPGSPKIMS